MPSCSIAVDRWRNRFERRRDTEALPGAPGGLDGRTFVRELALERHGYLVDEGWEEWLHRALGAAWPCPARERFDALWRTLAGELDGAPVPGTLWDADAAFARAAFCAAAHVTARRVVETGVARGITSRCLLEALGDEGRLWSIDMLPNDRAWAEMTQAAVPRELRARWTYVPGSTRRRLSPLLRVVAPIDVFLHDSHHTGATMRFELGEAWPRLKPGGVLLCDDVQENRAFAELVDGLPREQWAIGQEEHKSRSSASPCGRPPGRRPGDVVRRPVSIVIDNFDYERFLGEAVDSALSPRLARVRPALGACRVLLENDDLVVPELA